MAGKRPKHFFGECAWSDAQRYADDLHMAIRRAENNW